MKTINPTNLYSKIKTILQEARQNAYRAVNFTMVIAYWRMGDYLIKRSG
jgi:IS4 transposase